MNTTEAARFIVSYHKRKDPRDKFLRLGQSFCNYYQINNMPDLFYERDTQKAIGMIMEYAMEKEMEVTET